MISLCPGCHSKVHRIKVMRTGISSLLVELWREQHPTGHEKLYSISNQGSFLKKRCRCSQILLLRCTSPTGYLVSLDELGSGDHVPMLVAAVFAVFWFRP